MYFLINVNDIHLHKDPRSQESENITEGKEKTETDDNIHRPSFCLLGVLFALTTPCPKYSCSDKSEYSEEHCEVDEPLRDGSDIFPVTITVISFSAPHPFSLEDDESSWLGAALNP